MTTDPSAQGAYYSALKVRGVPVTLQRVTGNAPNAVVASSVSLNAIVLNFTPGGGLDAANLTAGGPGSIRLGDRKLIVMAADLSASGFALPVVQGDQAILPDSSEVLTIVKVDAYERRFGGAIEITAAGVT